MEHEDEKKEQQTNKHILRYDHVGPSFLCHFNHWYMTFRLSCHLFYLCVSLCVGQECLLNLLQNQKTREGNKYIETLMIKVRKWIIGLLRAGYNLLVLPCCCNLVKCSLGLLFSPTLCSSSLRAPSCWTDWCATLTFYVSKCKCYFFVCLEHATKGPCKHG